MMNHWMSQRCAPCEKGTPPMTAPEIRSELNGLAGWEYVEGVLAKTFTFKNYYETTAFVQAAAWVAHREDHHPDISFGYKQCVIRYSTHSVGGISRNDFICAAKTNALLE